MSKASFFTETIFTSVEPKRALRLADECLLEIRLIENRHEASKWIYEYEVSGEAGKVEKFHARLHTIEIRK